MPRPTSKATKDPWAGLTEALARAGEKRPIGDHWLTTEQIAVKLGKKFQTVQSYLGRHRNQFEMFRGCISNGKKLVTSIWWRPIQLDTGAKRGNLKHK